MPRPLNRLISAKPLLAAAVAVAALGAATAANAHTDVVLSVGSPVPAYAPPPAFFVQPEPVYVPQPVYEPAPVVYYDAWGRRYVEPVRHERYWTHRDWGRRGWRDDDRDGVPNRYDRAPHDAWRR